MKTFQTNIGAIQCPDNWDNLTFARYAKFIAANTGTADSFCKKIDEMAAITGESPDRLENLNANDFVKIYNFIAGTFGQAPTPKTGRPSFTHNGTTYQYRMHLVKQFSLLDKYKDYTGASEERLVRELATAFIEKDQTYLQRFKEWRKYGRIKDPFIERFNFRKEAIYAQSVQDVTDMVFFLKILSSGYTPVTLCLMWAMTQTKILTTDDLLRNTQKDSGLITSFIRWLSVGILRQRLLQIQAQVNSLNLSTGV